MPFVGHLETGHRRPSEKTIAKLAKVLGLDRRELFLLANPDTREFLRSPPQDSTRSAWDQFKRNQQLHRAHKISLTEMSMLERAALLGDAESPEDFIFILNTVRRLLKS
jgi:transcriptional regulator with XRE-family HTH domain